MRSMAARFWAWLWPWMDTVLSGAASICSAVSTSTCLGHGRRQGRGQRGSAGVLGHRGGERWAAGAPLPCVPCSQTSKQFNRPPPQPGHLALEQEIELAAGRPLRRRRRLGLGIGLALLPAAALGSCGALQQTQAGRQLVGRRAGNGRACACTLRRQRRRSWRWAAAGGGSCTLPCLGRHAVLAQALPGAHKAEDRPWTETWPTQRHGSRPSQPRCWGDVLQGCAIQEQALGLSELAWEPLRRRTTYTRTPCSFFACARLHNSCAASVCQKEALLPHWLLHLPRGAAAGSVPAILGGSAAAAAAV